MILTGQIKWLQCLLYLTALFASMAMEAQLENISISKEVHIDKLYAGLLTSTSFLEDNSNYRNSSSFQFGARVNLWIIPETFRIRSFGVVKFTEREAVKYIRSYEAIFTPSKKIAIHVGKMATPITELRPNPTTWQSQVETNAESTIPGGKPGIKLKYNVSKDLNFALGIHDHNNQTVQHLKISYRQLAFATFLKDQKLFSAIKWQYEKGSLIITRNNNETTFSSIITVSTHYKFYLDMQYDDSAKKLTYGEWGLRRSFSKSNTIRGFLSIGYNYNSKNFQGGLFIHI